MLSFIYSLRKRKIFTYGSLKTLLKLHEYFSRFGTVLILVHVGIQFNAILLWLALLACWWLWPAVSQVILLNSASQNLTLKKGVMQSSAVSPEHIQKAVFNDALYVDVMQKWRSLHMPITLLLGLLSALHILTTMIFSRRKNG